MGENRGCTCCMQPGHLQKKKKSSIYIGKEETEVAIHWNSSCQTEKTYILKYSAGLCLKNIRRKNI